jgi:hypothetical protein
MTLQTSGAITLQQIALEFGGATSNITLQNYYAGGANVPAGTLNSSGIAIPSANAIRLEDFYGAANITFYSGSCSAHSQSSTTSSNCSVTLNEDGTITYGGVHLLSHSGLTSWASGATVGPTFGASYTLVVDSITNTSGSISGPGGVGSRTVVNGLNFSTSAAVNNISEGAWTVHIINTASGFTVATITINLSTDNT